MKVSNAKIIRPLIYISFLMLLHGVGARDKCTDVLQARLDCYDTEGPCDPLPIPDLSFGPQPDPEKGYIIQSLRDGMYAVTEGAYWFLVVVSPSRGSNALQNGKYTVGIFDMPEGSFVLRDTTGQVTGSKITKALDEIVTDMNNVSTGDVDRVTMVYSHGHFDHIGGATVVYNHIRDVWGTKRIKIIAHEDVKSEFEMRIEAKQFSFRAPIPTITVMTKRQFRIGNDFKFSVTPARGHSADKDLVIFFEREGEDPAVMMFVDVVFPGWAPFFSFALTTDVFSFLNVHTFLLNEFPLDDDSIFIGGHLTNLGSKEDIEISYEYTKAVIAGAQEGLATVPLDPIVAASGVGDVESNNLGNHWLLFGLYFDEVEKVCAKKVVAEFGCVLASVDVTAKSACNAAQSYLRIDF